MFLLLAALLAPSNARLYCEQDFRKGDGPLLHFSLLSKPEGTFDAVYEADGQTGMGPGGPKPPERAVVSGLTCAISPADALSVRCSNKDQETLTTEILAANPAAGYPEESVMIRLRYREAGGSMRVKMLFSQRPSKECVT